MPSPIYGFWVANKMPTRCVKLSTSNNSTCHSVLIALTSQSQLPQAHGPRTQPPYKLPECRCPQARVGDVQCGQAQARTHLQPHIITHRRQSRRQYS